MPRPATAAAAPPWHPAEVRRALADARTLLRLRAATVRRPRAAAVGLGLFLGLTVAIAWVPATLPGAGALDGYALDTLVVLPTAFGAVLLISVVSTAAGGGGRELLDRDAAAVLPLSPTTDHAGALLLSPLNIGWVLQLWTLLGAGAYALGDLRVPAYDVGVALWLVVATAAAQALAWCVEVLRRTAHGVAAVRVLALGLPVAALALQAWIGIGTLLDRLPLRRLVITGLTQGFTAGWALAVLGLLVAAGVLLAAGAVPAHVAARLPARDEGRLETGHVAPRPTPARDLAMLVRIDRASVWRAVPMRRGLAVLALGPGAVALLGAMDWPTLTVLPGLVASGAALLFGVNAWCLDGRGVLWRESLPATSGQVFAARAWVLAEFLLLASLLTLVVASLRAGAPTAAEVTAVLASVAVVVLQVVGGALRWSLAHPYAVDLRSARATPAPPLAMVGYSSRLALSTTFTCLVFSGAGHARDGWLPLLLAVPFLCWSGARLARSAAAWADPVARARVTMTVAG